MPTSRILLSALILTTPLWSSAQTGTTQTQPHDLLLAANQGDRDLSVIDLKNNVQVARIPEGAVTGHEVATSEDGRLAFVPIYGDSTPGKEGTDGDQIAVLDVVQQSVVHRILFGHGVRPHCIVRNSKDGLLYVTTELDQTVSIIDPQTFKIVGSIPTGRPQSHMLAISHDGRFAYTANIDSGTVSVLDLVSRRLVSVIPVADEIQRISISADDKTIFTADQKQPRMAVIDVGRQAVMKWVDLPGSGFGSAVTPDGRSLLMTIPALSEIAAVDLRTLKVAKVVHIPSGPREVLVENTGRTAFVSCTDASTVARIDLHRWTVVRQYKAGNISDGITLDHLRTPF